MQEAPLQLCHKTNAHRHLDITWSDLIHLWIGLFLFFPLLLIYTQTCFFATLLFALGLGNGDINVLTFVTGPNISVVLFDNLRDNINYNEVPSAF